jgi:hypothetical protein
LGLKRNLSGIALILLTVLLMIIGTSPIVSATSTSVVAHDFYGNFPSNSPNAAKLVCAFGAHVKPSSLFPVKRGLFVEDWATGDLDWCGNDGSTFLVAGPPAGGAGAGYIGMGSATTGLGLVLGLMSWSTGPGVWFCIGATPNAKGCVIESSFDKLPPAFCSSLPHGNCYPAGMTMDSELNIYYADFTNAVVVKCNLLSANQGCSVIETLAGKPYGIFRDATTGNIWVTDDSCTGRVWENGVIQDTLGDALEGITVSSANPYSSPHVYVADTKFCIFASPTIVDLTDGVSLHTPVTSPQEIAGLTNKLQFAVLDTGNIYSLHDKS